MSLLRSRRILIQMRHFKSGVIGCLMLAWSRLRPESALFVETFEGSPVPPL